MRGEIAPSGPSERLPVWVPYVVRRAERTICRRRHAGGSFRKSVGMRDARERRPTSDGRQRKRSPTATGGGVEAEVS